MQSTGHQFYTRNKHALWCLLTPVLILVVWIAIGIGLYALGYIDLSPPTLDIESMQPAQYDAYIDDAHRTELPTNTWMGGLFIICLLGFASILAGIVMLVRTKLSRRANR